SALGGPAYAAAKAAIIGFTRHTSAELATDNVTINAVAPGLVFTERVRERVEQRAPEEQQRLIGAIPLGRAAQPEEPPAAGQGSSVRVPGVRQRGGAATAVGSVGACAAGPAWPRGRAGGLGLDRG